MNHCGLTISTNDWEIELIFWRRSYNVSYGDLAERLNRSAEQAEKDTAGLVGPRSRA